ncbi:MAG: cell division protein ZapA [Pseudomonadota bacterium]
MSQKTVIAHVYGKEYTLACDTGQEQHLMGLVAQINERTQRLEKAVGKLPEPLMLLYTALMIADEMHDTSRDHARAKDELARALRQLDETSGDDTRLAALEDEVAESLHAIATRIEGLAEKLSA